MTPPVGLPKRMPVTNLYHVEIIKTDPDSEAREVTRSEIYADDASEAMRASMESADRLSGYYGRDGWLFKSIECELVKTSQPPKHEEPEANRRSWLCRLLGC